MRQAVSGSVVTALGLSAMLMGCAPADQVAALPSVSSLGSGIAAEPLAIGSAASPPPRGRTPADDALSIGAAGVDTTGGSIPDGQMISPFDVENPVVGLLDPSLANAIQEATKAAAADGVDVKLTSGWRSKGFQKRLFDDAVATYGSADVASQFVASPDVSMHVLGKAVDVGPTNADDWMIRNGARFGLCQIYANEIWHFELALDAQGNCPALRPNAAG
ncbi:MAG: M15 family metallopeptidase [Mycobacterium sp.]